MVDTQTRSFVLVDKNYRDTTHVFRGKAPRAAALKAANRGFTDIRLRERGTKKIHVYTGARTQVPRPLRHPDWMTSEFIYRPNVAKVGVEHIDKVRR